MCLCSNVNLGAIDHDSGDNIFPGREPCPIWGIHTEKVFGKINVCFKKIRL